MGLAGTTCSESPPRAGAGDVSPAIAIARVRSWPRGAIADGSRTVALTLTSSRADLARPTASAAALGLTPGKASARLVHAPGLPTADLVGTGTPLEGPVPTGGDTGGETAKTIAAGLGAEAIEILDQVEPGIPLGRIRGRHHMLIVTKAGGFGSETSLVKSVQRIEAHGRS